jgi:purine-binding chemotaxis protein CheW
MNQPRQDNVIPWNPSGHLEVLTFDLQGEMFALEAAIVREILDMAAETTVPGASAFVGGVINFRGKVIPLADLRLAFGMETAADTIDSRIVVVEMDIDGERTLVGLRTDKVHEVATLSRTSSEAAPAVGMRWRPEYILCLVKRAGEFVVLPDLPAIFAANRHAQTAPGEALSQLH